MGNPAIYNRLYRFGLRPAADAYKDEVRQRRKAAGDDKRAANQAAEDAMWDAFRPAVEQLEKQQLEKQEQEGIAPLAGCADDVDQFLDPDYTETDPGKWLRDGLIWTAAEIRRVVVDSDGTTTVDLSRAHTKPPTAWAVFCLESFARKPIDKRGELIARVLPFAMRSHDTPHQAGNAAQTEGFLDSIE